MENFLSKWNGKVEYIEKKANNIEEAMLELGRSGSYNLIIVGKGRFPSTMVAELADRQAEHAELGPIGDILSSSNNGVVSSVLVVQQHDSAYSEEAPVSKVVNNEARNLDTNSIHVWIHLFLKLFACFLRYVSLSLYIRYSYLISTFYTMHKQN